MTKKWYQSKTLKVNIAIILGVAAQMFTNTQIFDADIQLLIVAAINVALRFITKEEIVK